MTNFSNKRFSDRARHLVRTNKDFAVRRRITDAQVFSIVCAVVVVAVGFAFIVVNDMLTISEKALVGSQAFILIAITITMLAIRYKKLHDTLQATEFLSATFISVLSMHCKFCLLTTPDGEILYLDRAFQGLFPLLVEQPKWSVSEWLILCRVPEEQSRKILNAIAEEKGGEFEMTLEAGDDKKNQTVQLLVEIIPRPSGVIMLRGK